MFSKVLWLYSPATSPIGRLSAPLVCVQVRGKKQKFGGATRDPFKSLQRKLVREEQRKHVKVPLMSDERAQIMRLAPITTNSLGENELTCRQNGVLSASDQCCSFLMQVSWWPHTHHWKGLPRHPSTLDWSVRTLTESYSTK